MTEGDAAAVREVSVAAPPWAADALASIDASGRVPARLRHVVIDPKVQEMAEIQGIRVLWRYHLRPDPMRRALDALPDLQWVHSDYVGVEDLPLDALAMRGVVLSNGSGVSANPMAEWIVLALLLAAKQLPRFVRQSDAGLWELGDTLGELQDAEVLMLGLGAIATRAAALLEPFGAHVRATTRLPRHAPPRGVAELLTGDEWRQHLAHADFVVCTLPLTAATAGAIDAEAFAAMQPGAWLVNVSRGAVIDETALLDALDAGRLGGAVLDAFAEEPLPTGHPLWGRPNVVVLPHVTWSSDHTLGDFTWRFAAELQRFVDGMPPSEIVDLDAGY